MFWYALQHGSHSTDVAATSHKLMQIWAFKQFNLQFFVCISSLHLLMVFTWFKRLYWLESVKYFFWLFIGGTAQFRQTMGRMVDRQLKNRPSRGEVSGPVTFSCISIGVPPKPSGVTKIGHCACCLYGIWIQRERENTKAGTPCRRTVSIYSQLITDFMYIINFNVNHIITVYE